MRAALFHARAIRGCLDFSLSSLYETGEEFLTEVFLETFPRALDSYAEENGDTPEPPPFMKRFNVRLFRKVYDTYSSIQDNMPHDLIVIRQRAVQVYREAREDAPIPDTFLKQGVVRRILGRASDGKREWIKTKLKTHGRTVYVREEDVECQDMASAADIDHAKNQKAPGNPENRVMLSDTYEDYILSLLSPGGAAVR